MSDIKVTVLRINTLLKAGCFKGKPFQQGSFNGVAELIKKTKEEDDDEYTIPVVMDADGNDGTETIINDKFPFQLYHRVLEVGGAEAEIEDTFGDGDNKSVIFEMALIIFADRFDTELDADDYITSLLLDIPRTIKATDVTGSQFSKCEITFNETITDASAVLTQEYLNSEGLKQSYIALSFGYEVKFTYTKGCFVLC